MRPAQKLELTKEEIAQLKSIINVKCNPKMIQNA